MQIVHSSCLEKTFMFIRTQDPIFLNKAFFVPDGAQPHPDSQVPKYIEFETPALEDTPLQKAILVDP